MSLNRRYALGGVFIIAGLGAAVLLASVLSTVFFAVTVAYLLWPVRQQLLARGLSRRFASGGATAGAFAMTLLILLPLAVVAYLRFDSLVALLGLLPDTIELAAFGFEYAVTLDSLTQLVTNIVQRGARRAATSTPVLIVKATLFVFLVYSLLFYGEEAKAAAIALVPADYRGPAMALNRRARETLFAIYVLQAATAVGTFILALPVFYVLGYDSVVTLSTVAAVLQFIPVLGPSVLLAGLAAYHVAVAELVRAALVIVLGGFVIALLPDVLIRPRLARETADIPGSLYFIGFFGGVLTLGPIGIVAGPLAVGLFVESAALLSAELNPEELSFTAAHTDTAVTDSADDAEHRTADEDA